MALPLSRNREFRLLWSGQALSSLGSQISQVAYPLLVLGLTRSAAKAGLVGFAHQLPYALLALPAGTIADRLDRKLVMVASDVVRLLALALIPIWLAAGSLPYGVILTVAGLDGAGFIVTYTAERGALRRVVPEGQLREAVARNEARDFGSFVAGPPLGGVLFGVARAFPFLADALSYLVSATTKLLIRTPLQESREEGDARAVLEGVRWLWQRPFFRSSALLFSATNPLLSGLLLLMVLLAKHYGASSALIGLALAIASSGGLVGALLAPRAAGRFSPRGVIAAEAWAIALTLPLLLLAHNALLIGLLVAAAVLITPVTNSIVVGYRVALCPDRLQGRVQAASTLLSFAVGWAGPLVVGLLFGGVGISATILVLSGWALTLALYASLAPAFREPPET